MPWKARADRSGVRGRIDATTGGSRMEKEAPRTMSHITAAAATVLVFGIAVLGFASTSSPELKRPARYALVDSAPSIEVLLQRVLEALAANDAQAFRRLRVTETEYREFVIPGSAKEGQPPQILGSSDSEFYWQMLNTKSAYKEAAVLKQLGGRRYTLKGVAYAKGHKRYAWYDAYVTTVLTLESDDGTESELVLGSIAHVDGQYKFVGLHGDR
jgi:hypothetical protein